MKYNSKELKELPARFRGAMMNCISGFKSASLIATKSKSGVSNLAIFNSVHHIGANPPIMGFILRPLTVERHTFENIIETGYYTINHIHSDIIKKAHQTAAKYDKDQSEFSEIGLDEDYIDDFPAPFVKSAKIKIGIKYLNHYEIKENGTVQVLGSAEEIHFPEEIQADDGWLDLAKADTVAINGLDSYYKAEKLARYTYAVPEKMPEKI